MEGSVGNRNINNIVQPFRKTKLFMIPYAGGNVQIFEKTAALLSDRTECHLIDYAGHGTRFREAAYQSISEMFQDVAEIINRNISPGDRIALFGYSIGSIVVYEILARQLITVIPEHIFLASHESPDTEWKSKQYHSLSDEALINALRHYGGFERVNRKMLYNPRFYKIFIEPVRRDYDLIGQYRMSRKILLPAPATVFYGQEDLTSEQIHTWDPFLMPGSRIIELPGKHFFIREYAREIAGMISEALSGS